MDITEVYTALIDYPRQSARQLPALNVQQLNAHPGGHPNSIAWLLWHSGREIDVQLGALHGGTECWVNFRDRFALGPVGDSIGYGHRASEASHIVVTDRQLLLDYLDATLDALTDYVLSLAPADFDEIIDRGWDPPVTRGVRLLSITDDAIAHIAQAAYVAGALTRTDAT